MGAGVLVVDGGEVGWCGAGNSIARAAGTSRKTPPFLSLVFVCLDAGSYCLVCVIVSFCFVLFCWVGLLCACFIYYLFTAHSIFTRYSKKLIPQWVIQSNQENRTSYSLAE